MSDWSNSVISPCTPSRESAAGCSSKYEQCMNICDRDSSPQFSLPVGSIPAVKIYTDPLAEGNQARVQGRAEQTYINQATKLFDFKNKKHLLP